MQQSQHEFLPVHLGISGANAIALVRAGWTPHHNFKIAYTTAYDDFATSEVMHKPIDQDMLLRTFRRTLFSVTSP